MRTVGAVGRGPAEALIDASIAREVIRRRKAVKLTQQRLAKLAGARQETDSRLESAKHSPTARTVEKIEAALTRAGRRKR